MTAGLVLTFYTVGVQTKNADAAKMAKTLAVAALKSVGVGN